MDDTCGPGGPPHLSPLPSNVVDLGAERERRMRTDVIVHREETDPLRALVHGVCFGVGFTVAVVVCLRVTGVLPPFDAE